MRIQKIDPSKLSQAYNILCQGVYPVEGATHFPFGTTYCEVEPLGFSLRHAHHDNETFLILAGTGVMEIAGEKAIVAPGSVILIPPHSSHRLDNTSDTDRLKFISIYWTAPLVEGLPQDLIVIPAPPTPNGPLHLGHLSGPYLAADVFTRYAAGRGSRAFHAMGTDDNQCYVLAKGRQLGLTGEEVAARFVPTIMGALKKFGCQVDAELHPLGVYPYTQFVQHTFSRLIDKGVLELRRVPTPFCEDTQQFLYGAQVSGGCPHCGVTTNGNGCEACGYYNDCSDLVAPKSNVGRGPVVLKEAEKYYFPLSRYGEALSEILSQVVMHPKLREFYLGYLEKGLPDVAVSQFGTWGVPCAERPGQVLYEWFEMAGSYLFLAQSVQKEHGTADFWRSNEAGVVEAFGIDNSFFYGLLMPALLREIDPMVKAPRAFLWNYFFQLEGKKFSTSRGHAIWADEILSAVPPDSLRFYLSLSRSEDRETNYDLSECEAFVRSELAGRWDGFLRDLDADLEKAGRAV
ncbi:MAG: class I tRNA ligase family protein, partial [Deltaproteobacteria bacterium]|nr:class I tRNA ligase family protein [Deltaproteobacteria bacterium]